MKKSFEDFIEDFPIYQSLRENLHAKKVFDLLNRDSQIFLAIEFSKRSKPALLASIPQIEEFIDSLENSTFDLSVDFNRQCVGKMQLEILKPFGWTSIKNSSKSFTAKYFRTGSCYEFHPESATMILEVTSKERSQSE